MIHHLIFEFYESTTLILFCIQCKWQGGNNCRFCNAELPKAKSGHFDNKKCEPLLKLLAAKELRICPTDPKLLEDLPVQTLTTVKSKNISVTCSQCNSKYNSYAQYFQHKVILKNMFTCFHIVLYTKV